MWLGFVTTAYFVYFFCKVSCMKVMTARVIQSGQLSKVVIVIYSAYPLRLLDPSIKLEYLVFQA